MFSSSVRMALGWIGLAVVIANVIPASGSSTAAVIGYERV